jgi:RNA polymerase sigma-70 factor (ECF subfamily)
MFPVKIMELQAPTVWMSRIEPQDKQAEAESGRLIAQALAGDTSAFEQIVMRHERRVLTLACRLLGNIHDAQDASQEVFIRAYRFLHRFDTQRALEPWLIRMTVNVCRDVGRRRQSRRSVPLEGELLTANADPYAELDLEERRRMLHRALDGLPAKERAAIVLRDIEGLSTEQVARLLGSAQATVRAQVSSARLKVRKAVEKLKRGRS